MPGLDGIRAVVNSVLATVVYRHIATSARKVFGDVLCTHCQLESAADQWHNVLEMLVKAFIHQFVSTSNVRGKKSLFFLKNREVSCFSVD